tara:strand:- start:234 stop:2018 length:1785 start_codon:yes stop_codon:yes gene_type:complete
MSSTSPFTSPLAKKETFSLTKDFFGSSSSSSEGGGGGGGGGTPTTSTFVLPFRKISNVSIYHRNYPSFLHGVITNGSGSYKPSTSGHITSASDVTNGGRYDSSVSVGRTRQGYYTPRPGDDIAILNFPSVNIANSATINSAKLKLTKNSPYDPNSSQEYYRLAGVLVDNGSIFHMPAGKGATVHWSNFVAASDNTQIESPDIKDIIQEIVNLPAWRSGNGITLYMYYAWEGTGTNSTTGAMIRFHKYRIAQPYHQSSGVALSNNDGTTRVPELVIEHTGGSDTGQVVEADDTLQLLGNASGTGQFLRSNNDTYDNSGSYSSIRTNSLNDLKGGFTVGVESISFSSTDTLTFGSLAMRFPNIQIAQGATVPTTKLSFYTFHDYQREPTYVSYESELNYLTPVPLTGHTLESGHHALNGDGTNDAVGFRIRALNRDNIPSDFSTLGTSDFDHPQGLSNTGTSDMTSAFVDIPFSSIMTEATSYGAKGNLANIVTADIKSIIQEVVNRSGWSSGNDIALFIYLPQSYSSASGSDYYNDYNFAKQDIIKMIFINPNIESARNDIGNSPAGLLSTTRTSSVFNASTKKNLGREPKLIIG